MATSLFAVTTATNSVRLDGSRAGEALFTVFNASGRPVRGRALVVAQEPVAQRWATILGDAERDFSIAGTQQYPVRLAVPPDAPAGAYSLRLDMVGVENPDEFFTEGPMVRLEVPAPEKKRPFPWLAVVAVLVVLGGGGGGFLAWRANEANQAAAQATATALALMGAATQTAVAQMATQEALAVAQTATAQAMSEAEQVAATQTAVQQAAVNKYTGTWLNRDGATNAALSKLVVTGAGQAITVNLYAHARDVSTGSGGWAQQACPDECLVGTTELPYTGDPLLVEVATVPGAITHRLTLTSLSDTGQLSVVDQVYVGGAQVFDALYLLQRQRFRPDLELEDIDIIAPVLPGP